MPRARGDDGVLVRTDRLDNILNVFDAVDGRVVLPVDIADESGCTGEIACRKLTQLHGWGDLAKTNDEISHFEP